jgi:streptogramin lyase
MYWFHHFPRPSMLIIILALTALVVSGSLVRVRVANGPTPAATPGITEYPVPTANSGLTAITTGSDGALWFVESLGNKIGKITPAGQITEYPLTTLSSSPNDITTGPDGAVWATELIGRKLAKVTPAGQVTEYPLANGGNGPGSITAGLGHLWVSIPDSNVVVKVTTAGTVAATYPISMTAVAPEGMAFGSDGALWITESAFSASGIARLDVTTGAVTEFPTPTESAQPRDIVAGPDGAMWFTEGGLGVNQIGRITMQGQITEYQIATDGTERQPAGIAVGSDGMIYFGEAATTDGGFEIGPGLGSIDPATKVFTGYTVPTTNSSVRDVVPGPRGVWFVEYNGNKIGRFSSDLRVYLPVVRR